MIDIHTHIIPDLDDGPPDMEASIEMGRIAEQEGITAIISTSHSEEAGEVGREAMEGRLDEVRAAWSAAGLNIRLELGMEIFLRPDTPRELKEGRVWPLAGSQYALVELPYQPWPLYAEQTLFGLQLAGYVPILAHPERYTAIQADPARMYTLAERGVLGQVTAGALQGHQGSNTKKTAETLLRHRLVQFLSSDAHGTTERKRMPVLRSALHLVESLVGPELAHSLVTTNPAHILNKTPLAPDPLPFQTRGRWSLGGLLGRS